MYKINMIINCIRASDPKNLYSINVRLYEHMLHIYEIHLDIILFPSL